MRNRISGIIFMTFLCVLLGFPCHTKAAVTETEEFEILSKAFLQGKDAAFDEYTDLSGLISDINDDGRLELIIKGMRDDGYKYWYCQYAVYAYDDAQNAVIRLGKIDGSGLSLSYSQDYHMLAASELIGNSGEYCTLYQAARTGMTEEFTVRWDVSSQPGKFVYSIEENGASRELAVTDEFDSEQWDSAVGNLEELKFWPGWKFEYWEKNGYPQSLLSAGTDQTAAIPGSADEIADFEFPERELISYILAWEDMDSAWTPISADGTSSCMFPGLNSENFWKFISHYVIYNIQNSSETNEADGMAYYYRSELEQIAYMAFPEYSGELPEIPDNYNIEVSGEQYLFYLATPEQYSCELQNITAGENGNIEAVYTYANIDRGEPEYTDTFQISIYLTDDSEPAKAAGVNYRINGLTYISGDTAAYSESNISSYDTADLEQMDYILPQSGECYLDYEDVAGLSLKEVNYAKNEIYAKAGRKFKSQELMDYFNSKAWYNGIYEPSEFDENLDAHLNEFERANVEFLSKVEHEIDAGGYQPN